jgi:hypothetical protein
MSTTDPRHGLSAINQASAAAEEVKRSFRAEMRQLAEGGTVPIARQTEMLEQERDGHVG